MAAGLYQRGKRKNDLILSPDASDPNAPDTLIGGEGPTPSMPAPAIWSIRAPARTKSSPALGRGGAADITIGGPTTSP